MFEAYAIIIMEYVNSNENCITIFQICVLLYLPTVRPASQPAHKRCKPHSIGFKYILGNLVLKFLMNLENMSSVFLLRIIEIRRILC